jgi:hypothetical protein
MTCNFQWAAKHLRPGGAVSCHIQCCILPKDHNGRHESAIKCIHPNGPESMEIPVGHHGEQIMRSTEQVTWSWKIPMRETKP